MSPICFASNDRLMIEIKIESREAERELARLLGLAMNAGPLMQNLAAGLESITQESFRSQSSPDGSAWEPHSPTTLLLRSQNGKGSSGAKMLIDEGHLLQSVFSDHSDTTASIGAGSGPSAAYALIHQFGGKAGRNKKVEIPARPYIPVTSSHQLMDGAEQTITEICLDYFTRS